MEGKQFGKYRLIKKIAAGGMAEIFYARVFGPSGFEKDMVVKKILPNLASQKDFIDMFSDEARIVARMNHPNIVQVFDFGNIDGQYYIAMEYVNGRDLRQVIDRHRTLGRPMDIRFALTVVRDVAKALQYAHSMRDENGQLLGIIHRDVTPRNILISFQGAVKLTDFGVAKAKARISHTRTGVIKGKFGYMAPEQVMGREVDSRMDIFSLSSVLWESITLKRLFSGNSEGEILGKLLNQTVPSIQDYCPDHYQCLQEILNKGLARDPDMRFQSAAEMERAIRDCLVLLKGVEPDIGAYMKGLFGLEEQPLQEKPAVESKATMADDATLAMSLGNDEDMTLAVPDATKAVKVDTNTLQKDEEIISSGTRHKISRLMYAILFLLAGSGIGIWVFGHNNKSKPTVAKTKHQLVAPMRAVPINIPLRMAAISYDSPRRRLAAIQAIPDKPRHRHHKSKPGILTLNAIPWASVWIDGKKHGVTPITGLHLKAGRHRVKLKMGNIIRRFRLVIKSGRHLKKIVSMDTRQ